MNAIKNKIFVIGDLHANANNELLQINTKNFPEQKKLTKKDFIFQLGDFGFIWAYTQNRKKHSKEIKIIEKNLTFRNFSWFVILGNHENYHTIKTLPLIEKFGGKVRILKTSNGEIYFAERGEIYNINGQKIFTFGGALSQDKKDRYSFEDVLNSNGKIKLSQVSYWVEELPTQEEIDNAYKNLEKHNWTVDFVFTHTGPKSVLAVMENYIKALDPVSEILEDIANKIKCKEWHFGHLHTNDWVRLNNIDFFVHYNRPPVQIFPKED